MNQKIEHLRKLKIFLGKSVSERICEAGKIKNAMATAIMFLVEHDMADPQSEDFQVYSHIYCEAKYLEAQLKKIE